MSITKGFLAVIGLIYIALALWCALKPHTTARSIGFNLIPGAGESEYTTVYGGLQLALGLLFLLPLIRPEMLSPMLLVCLVVHASLVLFRTIGFVAYSGIPPTTYAFAALEWLIGIGAAVLYFWQGR